MTNEKQNKLDLLAGKKLRGADTKFAVYLSDRQVAGRYGVGRATPWRWASNCDTGFPSPVKVVGCSRWRLADLEKWESTFEEAALPE